MKLSEQHKQMVRATCDQAFQDVFLLSLLYTVASVNYEEGYVTIRLITKSKLEEELSRDYE